MNKTFLPTTRAEMLGLGWEELDIIIVSGDAYVDHPSFAAAIIGRYLQGLGYKVGIIDQPDCTSEKDFMKLGRPRLFFGISAGNMDSMVNHYTAQKKIRTDDAYSPDAVTGLRPNKPSLIYTQKLKTCFKNIPIVLGGIEASLRRIPHYDFWSDTVKNSILIDSKADILVYGSGENQIAEIAKRLSNAQSLYGISGTLVLSKEKPEHSYELSSFEQTKTKSAYHKFMQDFYANYRTKVLSMPTNNRFLVHFPPAQPLTQKQMDEVYDLPFVREVHPKYKKSKIPAFEQIRESITAHRGCFGGCNFCAIGVHQGKTIQSRSKASILKEIFKIAEKDYYCGTISDIGGPSANMYGMSCKKNISEKCPRLSCLQPDICPHLESSHQDYIKLLKSARAIDKVERVFIASGVRFDLALKDLEFVKLLVTRFTGGHLKLAPEHIVDSVLKQMNKPSVHVYEEFCTLFKKISRENNKSQYVLPYLIVGHPGTSMQDALDLAIYLKDNNIQVRQMQEFTPTPMSISTTMYYTEMDFESGAPINVPKGREIRLQKALAQWFLPENKKYVFEALKNLNRLDLLDYFFKNDD